MHVRKQQVVRKQMVAWVVGLATALGMTAAGQAQAQLPAFGMVGLATGQRAVLNLVLVAAPDAGHPGCRVTASFVDSVGRVFNDATGAPVRRTVILRPQIATSIQLLSADILPAGQQRRSIRPVVAPVRTSTAPSDCSCFTPSLEILAANGVTTLTTNGHSPRLGPNPPPPPPICEALEIPGQ
jgi:hypothetical protein